MCFLVGIELPYGHFFKTFPIFSLFQSSIFFEKLAIFGRYCKVVAVKLFHQQFQYNFDSNLTLFTFLALPYPEYEGQEVKNTEETLFTDKELFIMIDYHHGGKELAWNNFVIPIGKEKYYQG